LKSWQIFENPGSADFSAPDGVSTRGRFFENLADFGFSVFENLADFRKFGSGAPASSAFAGGGFAANNKNL